MGPIPTHAPEQEAGRPGGAGGKPESTTSRRSSTRSATTSRTPLRPGARHDPGRRHSLPGGWDEGDNGISSQQAYRLQPGTGWLVSALHLHAPGSLVTYEPHGLRRVRHVPVDGRGPLRPLVRCWSRTVPKSKHKDLDYLVGQLTGGQRRSDLQDNHYLEPSPVADTASEGYVDRGFVYATSNASSCSRPRS